jgi:hypothetical protein
VVFTQALASHASNPLREGGATAADAALSVHVALPGSRWELGVGVENLWDDDFQVFPGQPAGGRRASASLQAAW